jgi:hypothetical protein
MSRDETEWGKGVRVGMESYESAVISLNCSIREERLAFPPIPDYQSIFQIFRDNMYLVWQNDRIPYAQSVSLESWADRDAKQNSDADLIKQTSHGRLI